MLIFPGALPVAPPPEQAFAASATPSPVKTVAPVEQSAKPRNETGQNTGGRSGNQHSKNLVSFPDPDRPTGPTPAFEANLLEAEREKFRAGPNLPAKDDTEPDMEKVPEQYAQAPVPETHKVDITL